jgi:hypothetical protein
MVLCSKLTRIVVWEPGRNSKVPAVTLPFPPPVGFGEDWRDVPLPAAFVHRLPSVPGAFYAAAKYLFVDVTGLAAVWDGFQSTAG